MNLIYTPFQWKQITDSLYDSGDDSTASHIGWCSFSWHPDDNEPKEVKFNTQVKYHTNLVVNTAKELGF